MLTEPPMLAEGGLRTRRASRRAPVSWIGKWGVKLGFKCTSLLGVERALSTDVLPHHSSIRVSASIITRRGGGPTAALVARRLMLDRNASQKAPEGGQVGPQEASLCPCEFCCDGSAALESTFRLLSA